MKNIKLIIRPLVFLLLALTPLPSAFAQARWETSFARAKQLAVRSKKPLLMDFYAPWCGPCRMMEEETFTNPTVRALMQRMVCVRLNVDQEPPQALQYGVSSIPRLIVLRPGSASPVIDLQGFYEAGELIPELRRALGLRPGAAVTLAQEKPALSRVRQALQGNRFAALTASDPKVAKAGLSLLVKQLGTKNEAGLAAHTQLLRNAGKPAVPALIEGLSDPYLATRVASYRVLQDILGKKNLRLPATYDPWAPTKARQAQLIQWRRWWASKGTAVS